MYIGAGMSKRDACRVLIELAGQWMLQLTSLSDAMFQQQAVI